MERLTEKLKDGVYVPSSNATRYDIIDKLGEYEQAEEDGLLIRLPCGVGDTVWCIVSAGTKVVECKVLWIEISYNGILVFSLDGGWGDVVFAHLGKKWFLTKAEAEQALAKMKGV